MFLTFSLSWIPLAWTMNTYSFTVGRRRHERTWLASSAYSTHTHTHTHTHTQRQTHTHTHMPYDGKAARLLEFVARPAGSSSSSEIYTFYAYFHMFLLKRKKASEAFIFRPGVRGGGGLTWCKAVTGHGMHTIHMKDPPPSPPPRPVNPSSVTGGGP